MYICKLLYSNCVLSTHSSLRTQNSNSLLSLSFSPGTPKAPVILALALSPFHPFRFPRMHNYSLYSLPTLSTVLSMSFKNLFLSSPFPFWSYPTTTQTLILKNLILIQRFLELNIPNSIVAMCHTSFNRMSTRSLTIYIS